MENLQTKPETAADLPTAPVNEYKPGDVLAYVNPDVLDYMTFVGLLTTALDYRDSHNRVRNLDTILKLR